MNHTVTLQTAKKLKEECPKRWKDFFDNYLHDWGWEVEDYNARCYLRGDYMMKADFLDMEGYLRGFLREKGLGVVENALYAPGYDVAFWRKLKYKNKCVAVGSSSHYETAFLTAVYEAFKYLEEKK